jgi:hypothetical protein
MRTRGQRFGADSRGPCDPFRLMPGGGISQGKPVNPGLSFLGHFGPQNGDVQITAPLGRMTKYNGLLDIDSGSNAVFCGDLMGPMQGDGGRIDFDNLAWSCGEGRRGTDEDDQQKREYFLH